MSRLARRGAVVALVVLGLAGCCASRPPPAPLTVPAESRDPVAVANKLETLLTQSSPLRDENRTYHLIVDDTPAWRDPSVNLIWRQLAPRLAQRNPNIHLLPPDAAGDYRLTVVVDRSVPPGTADFRLLDAKSGAIVWHQREYLILHE